MRTREGHGDGQGQCSPADKPREHQRLPECHRSGSGRGRLISRQSGPVICLAVSNCAEGPAEEAGRGGGASARGRGTCDGWRRGVQMDRCSNTRR